MNEFFLHHLWKVRLFNFEKLETTAGEPLEVLKTGQHNTDAGPDFFNARVKIGNTLWAGNVEIHLKSSDWKNHAHDEDRAYDNVVLHVVLEHDADIKRKDGSIIPTLELKGKFDERLWKNYRELLQSEHWIPCLHRIAAVDSFTLNNWLDRLLAERLEKKTEAIFAALRLNNNNWEETFYRHLAKNFGFRLNAVPFEMLANSVSLTHLARHKNKIVQLEALLFGQAGMLEKEFNDEYPVELQQEYLFLKNKYKLEPMAAHQWKFLRLRPVNFPTIRIAQFAQLIRCSSHLFSKILECSSVNEAGTYFRVDVSVYWQSHFVFDKPSKHQTKHLGNSAIQNLVINTVVPFLFAYGKNRHSEIHQERAIQFLGEIPSEKNSTMTNWKDIGVDSHSAYRSQALLQLKNDYCSEKKCLTCSVGNKIINHVS